MAVAAVLSKEDDEDKLKISYLLNEQEEKQDGEWTMTLWRCDIYYFCRLISFISKFETLCIMVAGLTLISYPSPFP